MPELPAIPVDDRPAVEAWVAEHLGDVVLEGPEGVRGSPAFAGGQSAADAALRGVDLRGYAGRRSEVLPVERRGASRLSPYIRHGLLPLPHVWDEVASVPARDRSKFRDELLWQEYSRHVYARVGADLGRPLRHVPPAAAPWQEPWDRSMACMAFTTDELRRDGWLVNQTRMWLSSQWTVRGGRDWREGEDRFFRHLLDGSRAANRLGWQWTVGAGTGRPYGFARWQVEKRAPELCGGCELRHRCPIQEFPDAPSGPSVESPAVLRADPDPDRTGGPEAVQTDRPPEAVWLTAESLGSRDPAMQARPELPAVFVFDHARLARWRLSGKRLVFLAETLAELVASRDLELHVGDPGEVLAGRPLAATWTPVPGWRRLQGRLDVAERHPWPWLARPHRRSAKSFSAWRKGLPADRQRGA
ncbi:FAD-binding domain-containing protein [Patulibacter sp.]|uniref:FAD-binding domain-containing protein n=1 Tax=Patulibacter sp. TaxID=1912859 RepID=UPI002723C4C5|nr:FAD-binding domain-containing protein [Patulibacter sp.]MDO9408273.1 FAD-binding domain-containing protein [Patulibacter sp.]